ncbi:MAG: hypothetical protein LBP35_04130 [Candidatus Ancillula trichonymphae]|nr:hypothetical protein [Candidatus Ancillula trichonymphae]
MKYQDNQYVASSADTSGAEVSYEVTQSTTASEPVKLVVTQKEIPLQFAVKCTATSSSQDKVDLTEKTTFSSNLCNRDASAEPPLYERDYTTGREITVEVSAAPNYYGKTPAKFEVYFDSSGKTHLNKTVPDAFDSESTTTLPTDTPEMSHSRLTSACLSKSLMLSMRQKSTN